MGSLVGIFTNWQTTIAGIMAIVTTLGHLIMTITSSGALTLGSNLWTDAAGLIAGMGLLFAKDGNKTNSPNPVATHAKA